MKLVLDTNIYCDYAEGIPNVVDYMAAHGEDIFLPSIVIDELTYGFMKGTRQRFNEKNCRKSSNNFRYFDGIKRYYPDLIVSNDIILAM